MSRVSLATVDHLDLQDLQEPEAYQVCQEKTETRVEMVKQGKTTAHKCG